MYFSFLKLICGILNNEILISIRQMNLQDMYYFHLWKVKKIFSENIYSLSSNTYFPGKVTYVQDTRD